MWICFDDLPLLKARLRSPFSGACRGKRGLGPAGAAITLIEDSVVATSLSSPICVWHVKPRHRNYRSERFRFMLAFVKESTPNVAYDKPSSCRERRSIRCHHPAIHGFHPSPTSGSGVSLPALRWWHLALTLTNPSLTHPSPNYRRFPGPGAAYAQRCLSGCCSGPGEPATAKLASTPTPGTFKPRFEFNLRARPLRSRFLTPCVM